MALLAAAGLIALWGIDLAADWARLSAVFAPGGHLLGLEY
jgi:hypothetical protein